MLDVSLKRLQVDQVDLLHIHALMGTDDLAAVSAKGGAYEAAVKAKEQKMARFIGITCHAFPDVLKTALERHDFDCTQMALNAAMARMAEGQGPMKATPMAEGGFEELALPVAIRKQMGIIAMKVFAQDQIVGAAPIEKLLAYSLSLPVSLASVGMPKTEFIERNIELARNFTPMPEADRRRLSESIANDRKVSLVEFFRQHLDV
jgi:uncharacterized protein